MTTLSRAQAHDAHLTASKAANASGHDTDSYQWLNIYREVYTAALGLTIEDPKPEPGVYLTKQGDVLTVNTERNAEFPDSLWITGTNGNGQVCYVNAHQDRATWHPLTPARVVPAELPDRNQVEFDVRKAMYETVGPDVETVTDYIFTLLTKHGHGHALPDSEAVWQAIVNSRRSDGARLTATHATDAVMALLHGESAPTMPDWDDVRNAIAENRGNGWGLHDEAINAITDSVIALLEGRTP